MPFYSRVPRRWRLVLPLVVVALFAISLWAWTTFPPAYARQNQEPASFAATARRAIAHGRGAEAEALAKQRPANDPAAAAVLGQLAMAEGKYDAATAILEPAASRAPGSEAALQLGLLNGSSAVPRRQPAC